MDKSSVTSYCRTKNQFRKDSDTIASCIFDALNSTNWAKYEKVRLVSDGCAGQNKNSAILAMVSFWLDSLAPDQINEFEIIYPVTGHSFLSPDRVFGNIEKVLKQSEVIQKSEEVYKIISNFASVKIVGKDCSVLDVKSCVNNKFKLTNQWHFKISKCKRVYNKKTQVKTTTTRNRTVTMKEITVRGEIPYLSNCATYGSLFLPGHTAEDIVPNPMEETNILSNAKKDYLKKLLIKYYGENWFHLPELQFFVGVLSGLLGGAKNTKKKIICCVRQRMMIRF